MGLSQSLELRSRSRRLHSWEYCAHVHRGGGADIAPADPEAEDPASATEAEGESEGMMSDENEEEKSAAVADRSPLSAKDATQHTLPPETFTWSI
jgi:hypothetical protein